MTELTIAEAILIGENDQWRFCVGKLGERWIGYALAGRFSMDAKAAFRAEGLGVEPGFMSIFPEVSDGLLLGMLDREKAILLTGAIAQDVESCYGGVET